MVPGSQKRDAPVAAYLERSQLERAGSSLSVGLKPQVLTPHSSPFLTNKEGKTATPMPDHVRTLIGDKFDLQPRGEIEVKGKGNMSTYFLTGVK